MIRREIRDGGEGVERGLRWKQARTQDFEKGGSEYRVAVRLRRRGGCGIRAKLLHYE